MRERVSEFEHEHLSEFLIYLYTSNPSGYFTYDVLDIIFNKKLLQTWEVMVHHFAVSVFL